MNNIVYNRCCLEAMREMENKAYDLAIIDVPYGIGEDGRNNHTRGKLAKAKDYRHTSRYDNQAPDKDYFDQLFRVSKNQIIWGANHFISKIPYDSSCWIVWDKLTGDSDFADFEMAWTSFETAARKFNFRWAGMLQGNMKDKEERIHPNHKPIALYHWLLENYASAGNKILDTHVGGGSIRIACDILGYDFTGFEIDPIHFQNQEKRFKQHQSQLTLF